MSLIPIEQSYAYISLDGIIIGNNKLFSDICGISYQNLYKLKLISLARFSTPEDFMQSAYLLDLMGREIIPNSHNNEISWTAELNNSNSLYHNHTYDIVVTRTDLRIELQPILIARLKLRMSSPENTIKRSKLLYPQASYAVDTINVMNILLVDDSPVALKIVGKIVTKLGHTVSIATNGAEALDILKHTDFDLVLMDLNMPLMSGIEASTEYRKYEQVWTKRLAESPTIIAMSDCLDVSMLHEASSAGFNGFLPKPINEEKLHEAIAICFLNKTK